MLSRWLRYVLTVEVTAFALVGGILSWEWGANLAEAAALALIGLVGVNAAIVTLVGAVRQSW